MGAKLSKYISNLELYPLAGTFLAYQTFRLFGLRKISWLVNILFLRRLWLTIELSGYKSYAIGAAAGLLGLGLFGTARGGPRHPALYSLLGIGKPHVKIAGWVAPGFEQIKTVYEENFLRGAEVASQCCIYVGEEKVADLHGFQTQSNSSYYTPACPYSDDSIQVIFSCSKAITSFVIAMAVDKGYLDYHKPISHYWPEFGQNGKESVRVCDLLRHEAGLANFDDSLTLAQLENKDGELGAFIARQKQKFPATFNTRRAYHSITRGWILSELLRRVDPKGRTVGRFLDEEVRRPLGLDLWLGLPPDLESRVAPLVGTPFLYFGLHLLLPAPLRKVSFHLFELLDVIWKMKNSKPPLNIPEANSHTILLYDSPLVHKVEIPSANVIANAASMAKIAALIANGGELKGMRLIRSETLDLAHSDITTAQDATLFGKRTSMTLGGWGVFGGPDASPDLMERHGFTGWLGYGGSTLQWHREHKIGFAYATTGINSPHDFTDRAFRLQMAVLDCVTKRQRV